MKTDKTQRNEPCTIPAEGDSVQTVVMRELMSCMSQDHLGALMANRSPLGLWDKSVDLWMYADRSGCKIERFEHLDEWRQPVWVAENRPMGEWEFTETFRVSLA